LITCAQCLDSDTQVSFDMLWNRLSVMRVFYCVGKTVSRGKFGGLTLLMCVIGLLLLKVFGSFLVVGHKKKRPSVGIHWAAAQSVVGQINHYRGALRFTCFC
jgi:hypothetical protein